MSESSIAKAEKLAAARKRLKEYQAKEKVWVQEEDHTNQGNTPTTGDVSSTNDASNAFGVSGSDTAVVNEKSSEISTTVDEVYNSSSLLANSKADTIQILITEKTNLASELAKFRNICREKELENEELKTQFQMTSKRFDEIKQEFSLQHKSLEELKSSNITLQVQMQNTKSLYVDQSEHFEETKKLLEIEKNKNQLLQNDIKDMHSKLDLSEIRINQLSDEANITKDNRVESLTQMQFMHEQQIRDLQAMVQQLTTDKEQANQQYQTYVQHLNAEITKLRDRNNELTEENSKQIDRERQFVEHISDLEKQIQKDLSRKDMEENQRSDNNSKEIDELKSKLSELEADRYQFQLKIKSQEDTVDALRVINLDKDGQIKELQEHIQNILSEQPDSEKLLAVMESNKIAASRALTQNESLKKQLDELEIKFVQLTNDKADLVNKLDAEEYSNREIRNNFFSIKNQLTTLEEKMHFKDEEMIRLTHENNALSLHNTELQQQLLKIKQYQSHDNREYENSPDKKVNDNQYSCHSVSRRNSDDNIHNHDHGASHDNTNIKHTECQISTKSNSPGNQNQHDHAADTDSTYNCNANNECRRGEPPTIPTIEALQKLQNRFTKLMGQVADLSEEKQRLEHLVLQLQGETETIGEYIALYQTQRRILKQKEYEKSAQFQFLLEERKDMRTKITALNQLVSDLGIELPNNLQLNENLKKNIEQMCIEPAIAYNDDEHDAHEAILDESLAKTGFNSKDSKEILGRIQDIITDIKNTTNEFPPVNTVDHLTCCSGKFEIV